MIQIIRGRKAVYLSALLALSQFTCGLMSTGTGLAADQAIDPQPNDGKLFSISGAVAAGVGYSSFDHDTGYGTNLRLQLTVQPTPDLAFATRINASKIFDVETSDDTSFLVDRFYLSWDEIGNLPVRLTAGRLPTRGRTSPAYLHLGLDQPESALSSFVDIALDGIALEYRYRRPAPGSVQFYYATQIDAGYEGNKNESGLTDTTIYGLQWDILHHGPRSLQLQSFLFTDFWNVPEDTKFVNPFEFAAWQADSSSFDPQPAGGNLWLDRQNLGDIYQSSITYLDKIRDVHFFINLGWSHTEAKAMDELGTSLLGSWWDDPHNADGFAVYAGLRYDLDALFSTIGCEYNYGSKYWINFSQGQETAKLATRGSVAEVYWTIKPPLPAALANARRSLIGRLGYQHYDYDYTGFGSWLGEPLDIDELQSDPLIAHFYSPIDSAYNVYASLELYF